MTRRTSLKRGRASPFAVGNRTKMTTTNARPYGADSDTEGLYHLDDPAGTTAGTAFGGHHT